jgi:hypothetical protein
LPTTTFVASATTTVEPTASQPARDGGSGMDRLASELKALRMQAQSTEAGLTRLHQQAPVRTPTDGLRGSELAVAAGLVGLALGMLALRWWWRRPRAGRSAGAGAAAPAESSFLPETAADRPSPLVLDGASARRGNATAPELDRAALDAAIATAQAAGPRVLDSAFRPSSLDVTFVEHDALDAALQPAAPSRPDNFFAARDACLEFDPEAAANEVERVRKSLAAKRFERSRLTAPGAENVWNDDDPSDGADALLHSDALFATAQPPREVDVLIDFPDDALAAPAHPTPVDAVVEPCHETVQQTPPADQEVDVGVSLIQELRGLGLWSEARELAKELINSAHAPLDADIASTLHQVQHGTPTAGGERRKKDRG